jgi:hypothetical protein
MGKHRVRLLVCGVGALAMIIASTLVLDWFHANIGLAFAGVDGAIDILKIDLRSLRMCEPNGACASVPLSQVKGLYTTMAESTFWGSLVFAVFVAIQSGTRLFTGVANDRLTKIGYVFGALALSSALSAGYLFQPESTGLAEGLLEVQRTWAPLLLLAGIVVGYFALALSVSAEVSDDQFGEYKPITITGGSKISSQGGKLKPVTTPMPKPEAKRVTPDSVSFTAETSEPIVTPTGALGPTPDLGPTPEITDLPAPPKPFVSRAPTAVTKMAAAITQELLRKKLLYATAVAEIKAAGIEAKREDHLAKLVRWRDVVGVVARRLPQASPYEGITFVDLVSTAGATLRILPWTRMTGDQIDGEGDERARTFVQMIVARCPDAHVDPATRTFLGGRGPAAQLPDAETLAAHDARLA